MRFLIKLFAIFGLLFVVCYPIGNVLSRGPLGFWAWIIALFIALKGVQVILKE